MGLACEHSLDEALSHDVRKAAVGSGGVSIVLHSEAEVAGRGIAGTLEDVFSGPINLITPSERSAK